MLHRLRGSCREATEGAFGSRLFRSGAFRTISESMNTEDVFNEVHGAGVRRRLSK
jgi:hypothetical protein